MRLDVNIIRVKKEKALDYQEIVCYEFSRLGLYGWCKADDNSIKLHDWYSCCDEMFPIIGVLQVMFGNDAWFDAGYNNKLDFTIKYCSWKDVYNKIKDIDKIEWQIND